MLAARLLATVKAAAPALGEAARWVLPVPRGKLVTALRAEVQAVGRRPRPARGGAGGASTSATSDSGGIGGGRNGSSAGGVGAAASGDVTGGLAGQGGEGPEGPLLTGLLIEGGRLAQLPEFAPDRQRYSVIATDKAHAGR